jgi:exopolysaccharide production protein ExoQ
VTFAMGHEPPPQKLGDPGHVERAFVVLALLLSTGAFMNLTLPSFDVRAGASGMLWMQILWSLIYAVTGYLFLRRCDKPLRTFLSEWPLVALCGLAMASIFWSQAPGLTFRRSVALTLTLLFGVYFAARFSLKEQLRLLTCACGICVVFSFVFGILGLGTSVDEGLGTSGWYGVFTQKNALGYIMVLSALTFLFWGRVEFERRGVAKIGIGGSLLLIALSQSMTAIITISMLMILLPYLRWTARKTAGWMVGGIAFLLAAGTLLLFYVAAHIQVVTSLLGRSATLTGRVPLWILSCAMALRRPWLGYGFNAFWLPDDLYVQRIWQMLHWTPPHAHNGLIELWLEVGLIGVGLFVLVFANYLLKALRVMRHDSSPASPWPLLFLLFMFFANLTEPFFLSRNSIYLILYVASAADISATWSDIHLAKRVATSRESYA